MYLKTVGMDPAHHGISRELERVDLYKGKVDKALKLGGPTTKLDVPAAERMINAAKGGKKKLMPFRIFELSDEQTVRAL